MYWSSRRENVKNWKEGIQTFGKDNQVNNFIIIKTEILIGILTSCGEMIEQKRKNVGRKWCEREGRIIQSVKEKRFKTCRKKMKCGHFIRYTFIVQVGSFLPSLLLTRRIQHGAETSLRAEVGHMQPSYSFNMTTSPFRISTNPFLVMQTWQNLKRKPKKKYLQENVAVIIRDAQYCFVIDVAS